MKTQETTILLAYPYYLPPSVQPITIYSRFPLIWQTQDWIGAGLSNILDCQGVTKFCIQHSEDVLVSYFHFIIKRLSFLNYHMPNHRFSFLMQYRKPCKQHIVQLQ